MEWFLGRDAGHKGMVFPIQKVSKQHEVNMQLDLIHAAEQHVLWKTRLGHHVHGRVNESLETCMVGQDGICQLGAWINGSELHALRDTRAYRELDFAHSMFHEYGAIIVDKLHQGDKAAAELIFQKEYGMAMQHIIQALTKINHLLQQS